MKIHKLFAAIVLSLCLWGTIASPAIGGTIAVKQDFTGDYTKIQDAIDSAAAGDEVVVYQGIYTGTKNIDLDFKGKAITVRSSDPNDPVVVASTIIDCLGSQATPHRGFSFHSGEGSQSVLKGLTITHGYYLQGGGILVDSASSPTIANCVITGNSAVSLGGGILLSHHRWQ